MVETEELEEASYPFRVRALRHLCQYSFALYGALVLEMILLLTVIVSALFADLDRATETVLVVDFVLLGVVAIPTIAAIYLCARTETPVDDR